MRILVTGGAASGKSLHAERVLCEKTSGKRLYLATMEPRGAEAQARIERHRALRAGKGFDTVERPADLAGLQLSRQYDGILLEDLGNLLANTLFGCGKSPEEAVREILDGVQALENQCRVLVVVSNEIFSDGLRYDADTVRYMKALGRLHTALAADKSYESVCGILLEIKEG